MAIYDFTLQNTGSSASVNAGQPIWIRGYNITVAHKLLTRVSPNNSGQLAELNQGGFENPKFVIDGYVDQFANTATTQTVNALASTNEACILTLQQLAYLTQSSTSKIFFRAMYGTGGSVVIPIRGSAAGTAGFNVSIDSFSYKVDASLPVPKDTQSGKNWWAVNIEMTEVP